MTVWTGEALHGFKNRVARVQDMQVRGVCHALPLLPQQRIEMWAYCQEVCVCDIDAAIIYLHVPSPTPSRSYNCDPTVVLPLSDSHSACTVSCLHIFPNVLIELLRRRVETPPQQTWSCRVLGIIASEHEPFICGCLKL